MRLIPLTSTQIAAIGWKTTQRGDDTNPLAAVGTVAVVFQNGAPYIYKDVPMEHFVAVITDPDSQGHTFHELIKKPGYAYRKSTAEEIADL